MNSTGAVASSRRGRLHTISEPNTKDRLDVQHRITPSKSRAKSPVPVFQASTAHAMPGESPACHFKTDLPNHQQSDEQSPSPPLINSNGAPSPVEPSVNGCVLPKTRARLTRQNTEPTQLEYINFTSVA